MILFRHIAMTVTGLGLLAASMTSTVRADEPMLRRCLVTLVDEAFIAKVEHRRKGG
jgi:hypothetical protein